MGKPRRGRKAKNPKPLAPVVPEVVSPTIATKKKEETPIKPILKPAVFIPKTDEKKSDTKEPVAKKASTEPTLPPKEKVLPTPLLPSVKRVPREPVLPPTEKNTPEPKASPPSKAKEVLPAPGSAKLPGKKSPPAATPHSDEKQKPVKSKILSPSTDKSTPSVIEQKSKKDKVSDESPSPTQTASKPTGTTPPVVTNAPTPVVPIKKRGRPATTKTEPAEKNNTTEKANTAEKVNKVVKTNKVTFEPETEEEDEDLDPFKNVKGRKGKIGRKVVKLLQDIEQLLVYQEKQRRLRNRTLMDLPEA